MDTWYIFRDMVQGGWDKSAGNHAEPLVDPGSQKDGHAGHRQHPFIFTGDGIDHQDDAEDHQRHGSPHPGNIGIFTMKTDKQIFNVIHMFGDVAVERHKHLA